MASTAELVINLDRKRMQAMAAKDIATVDPLLADNLIYTHSSARVDTKLSLIASLKSGDLVYYALEPSDVRAQVLGEAVALTGLARVKVLSTGKEHDARVRFTDVYAKRSGLWQMVVWQSTRLPD